MDEDQHGGDSRARGAVEKPIAPQEHRKRGRPRQSEGPVVTREDIVREALVSTTGSGMAGLVLRDVARRLGVSLPTIQRHFATKDELWRACVDAVMDDVPVRADLDPNVPLDFNERVTEFLRNLINRTALYPHATAAMWNDADPGSDERLDYLAARMAPFVETARNRFSVAVGMNVFRDIDPDVFFALMVLGVSSLGRSKFALRRLFDIDLDNPEERETFSNALTDIFLNGLRTQPDDAPSNDDGGLPAP